MGGQNERTEMNRTEGGKIQFVLDSRNKAGSIISDKFSQHVLAGLEKEEILVDIGCFSFSLLPSNLHLISYSGLGYIQGVSGQHDNFQIQTLVTGYRLLVEDAPRAPRVSSDRKTRNR